MKKLGKYFYETIAIFIGILLSFSVDRCTRENQEIEDTKKSVLILVIFKNLCQLFIMLK